MRARAQRLRSSNGSRAGHSRPGQSNSPRNLQGFATDLQQTAGNAATALAVQRFSDGPFEHFHQGGAGDDLGATTTAAPSAAPAGGVANKPLQHPLLAGNSRVVSAAKGGNPLTIGQTNDGVATMQQGLDLVGLTPGKSQRPDGSFDGAWGSGTSAAVKQLQSSKDVPGGTGNEAGPKTLHALDDELMAKNGGGGGGGGGGGLDIPPQPTLNTELEKRLDQIMIEYTRLLVAQSKAVTQVERDLRDSVEKTSDPIFVKALMFAAEKVLDGLLGGAPTSLRTIVKGAIDFQDEIKNFAVDKPFDAAKKAAEEKIKEEANAPVTTEPLSAFISAQHNGLAEATLQNQINFANDVKPRLRDFTAEDVLKVIENPTGTDPRIVRADDVLKSVKEGTARAPDQQYKQTVSKWAQTNAQKTLGTTAGGPGNNDSVTFTELLKVNQGVNKVPGVLTLKIRFNQDNPKGPVAPVIGGASIGGLSPQTRAKLLSINPTLGEMNMPTRAMGFESAGFLQTNTELDVATDETRSNQTDVDSDDEGVKWLADRGNNNGFAGIASLFKDLDKFKIAQVGLSGP